VIPARAIDRRAVLLCTALLFFPTIDGAVAAAVAPVADAAPTAVAPTGETPLLAVPTRVDRIGRVVVPVHINGEGPFPFVVDTGANRSAISPRLSRELGLQDRPGADVRLSGVTGVAVVATVRVGLLQTGALRLENRELPVIEPPVLANADGILGMDGLRDLKLEINFIDDRVVIGQSRQRRPPPGFLVVPARRRMGGLLVVDARIGNVPVQAIIDTGAARSLGNRVLQRRLRIRPGDDVPVGSTEVFGATDAMQRGDSALMPEISLGQARLQRLQVTFGDLHVFRIWQLEDSPALLIGMDMLGTVSQLVIDFRRSLIYLKP